MEAMAERLSSQSMCFGIPVRSESFKAVPGHESLSPWVGLGTAQNPMPASCGQDSPGKGSVSFKHSGPEDAFHGPPGESIKSDSWHWLSAWIYWA